MWEYLVIVIALFIFELVYFRVAARFGIIDEPNERNSHTAITLKGGGIIFYLAVLFYFLFYGWVYPWFLFGLTLITIISFIDDIKSCSLVLRLLVHFISLLLLFQQWGLFGMSWSKILIALVFCAGMINAYNFMDGINGMAGGYSLVLIGVMWYVNMFQIAFVDNNLLYVLITALLIFNWFNFRVKARCFAGDVGSISIAFILLFLLGLLIIKTGDLSYILFLALYGTDTILTIIHRILLHENIFKPHRKHMFQIMANELKMPHLLVSGIYCFVQALISVGLIMTDHRYGYMVTVILLLCAVYVLFMKRYFKLQLSTNR
jgi:UDP-N-acetylmuramyl pentapeptide phosphotransferase/UDP-N-acetylglucosamine-1-phosphate transferase